MEAGENYREVDSTYGGVEEESFRTTTTYDEPSYSKEFLLSFANKMMVSFVLWIILIVFQFIVGIPCCLFGYGFATLACGVWNLINCIKWHKFMKIIRQYPTYENAVATYNSFHNSKTTTWIFLFVNLVFGGFLGAAGCGYDLYLCYHAEKNKDKLGVRD